MKYKEFKIDKNILIDFFINFLKKEKGYNNNHEIIKKAEKLKTAEDEEEKDIILRIIEPLLKLRAKKYVNNAPQLYHKNYETHSNIEKTCSEIIKILDKDIIKREHVIHPFYVYLIGLMILKNNEKFWYDALSRRFKSILNRFYQEIEDKTRGVILQRISEHDFDMMYGCWEFCSLFHDFGYILREPKLVVDKFLKEIYKDTNFKLEYEIQIKIDKNKVNCLDFIIRTYATMFLNGLENTIINFAKKLEKKPDHGYWSAAIIMNPEIRNQVISFETAAADRKKIDEIISDLFLIEGYISIAFHNNQFLYNLSPLLQLLIASDYAHEFKRDPMEEDSIEGVEIKFYDKAEIYKNTRNYISESFYSANDKAKKKCLKDFEELLTNEKNFSNNKETILKKFNSADINYFSTIIYNNEAVSLFYICGNCSHIENLPQNAISSKMDKKTKKCEFCGN